MFVKTVKLWDNAPGAYDKAPALDVFIPENQTSDVAVVVLPGGGYACHADYEGAGYAEFLNANGITAFVLPYRVVPYQFPLPLLDARRAVRYVRHHSKEYNININKVYIMGSSAGGHLAALTSTYLEPIEFEGADEIDKEPFRPNGQILCYPVIALRGEGLAHHGSAVNLLGDDLEALGDALSPHLIADENTPRAFIWHTFGDGAVPADNSIRYAQRLTEMKVSAELHVYPGGQHGMALSEEDPHVANWTRDFLEWLELEK
jgi:acetyl esterase/lipase